MSDRRRERGEVREHQILHREPRLLGGAAEMRKQHHVRQIHQCRGDFRFVLEDIQGGCAETLVQQRRHQIWKAFGLQPHRSEDVYGTRDIVAGRAVHRFKADAVAEESGSSAVR
jgi:hypothetical protein